MRNDFEKPLSSTLIALERTTKNQNVDDLEIARIVHINGKHILFVSKKICVLHDFFMLKTEFFHETIARLIEVKKNYERCDSSSQTL